MFVMVVDNGLARCRLCATGVVVFSILITLITRATLTILSTLSILSTLRVLAILRVLGLLALTLLLALTSRLVAQTLFPQVCGLLNSFLGILDTF